MSTNEYQMSAGQAIMEEIIRAEIVRAHCEGLCVWAANSAEVLEAIVVKYAPEVQQQTQIE